ncbi:hypothetical protein FB567DRAFT_567057 [Paraphoma chrysanthemicola]|uniref:Gylcosyl hydrolase 115 C-terminal domain-containing protein n=1 Tax=Paraphoma chrysanthemicola TaxID=798071 RepID=A0A8K0W3X9_9PLEO|nr:hypothetical protein FB567DRAFT_567057 [Paraphoma chrysanthemicola]
MRSLLKLSCLLAAASSVQAQLVQFSPGPGNWKLADQSIAPTIVVASNERIGVARAAQDLAWDFGRVVGVNGTVATSLNNGSTSPVIIVGTIGHSKLLNELVSAGKLDVSTVEGKWESYTSQVLPNPSAGVPWALVVAGSDRRGAIYGLYDVSEQIGVSPWYWWADAPVQKKSSVYVSNAGKVQGPPSIKYRGFFINDEAPALSSWVQKNFNGVFNSDYYRLVFELCLRLKGNYVWPAMWGKSFYVDDAKNGQLAHDFGIVMGTSHHEPMARSEKEQQNSLKGDWDWATNKENIKTFFTQGIQRAKNWDTYWTMGMRGKGDAASPTLKAADLEEIIAAQQSLLHQNLNVTKSSDIPQTWVLYKEVIDYYASGMKVPDDVTLLWTDDNSGNLIRVPIANETNRAGGAGVYYHFDYVGGPRNYKWINTIQLVKTWEQMHLAYNKNARQIWLVNVGDLKLLEIPLAHFMDMAYNFDRHTTPASTTDWIKRWATQQFGARISDETVDILNRYGILTARRKYELLSETPFAFNTTNYDEAQKNLAQWGDLLNTAQMTYDSLDQATRTSFFQLVLHPVMAGKTMVDLYTKVAMNKFYADQGRVSANLAAEQARALFRQDAEITTRYHTLNNGKWNGFVNQQHIGYTSWQEPSGNIMPNLTYISDSSALPGSLGIGIQGSSMSYPRSRNLTLLTMSSHMPYSEVRSFDLFALKNGTIPYTISTNTSYISLSSRSGSLKGPGNQSDVRIVITVDWAKVPAGQSSSLLTVSSGSETVILRLPLDKVTVPASFKGHVESNGAVAIEASHFFSAGSANGVSYVEIPNYGRTLSALKPWPATMGSQSASTGPALKYNVFTTTTAAKAKIVFMMSASHNHDPTRPLKFAWSVDGSEAKEVRFALANPVYKESSAWRKAVVENGWTAEVLLDGGIKAGEHEIKVWLLEPGVVLQRIVVDVGGLKPSALGPLESRRV